MSRLLLTLSEVTADAAVKDGSFDEVFLWTRGGRTTFTGGIDPHRVQAILSELLARPAGIDVQGAFS